MWVFLVGRPIQWRGVGEGEMGSVPGGALHLWLLCLGKAEGCGIGVWGRSCSQPGAALGTTLMGAVVWHQPLP